MFISAYLTVKIDGNTLCGALDIENKSGEIPITYLQEGLNKVCIILKEGDSHKFTQKQNRQMSRRQEDKVASKHIGGKRQPGSGSVRWKKSDVTTDNYRIECKATTAKSYRLSLKDLNKISSECTIGQQPLFNVQFVDRETKKPIQEYYIVPARVWEKLCND